MKNSHPNTMKTGFYLLILLSVFYILHLTGCGTVPQGETVSAYTINGISYYSLLSLCDSSGVTWQYDALTRTANLQKGSHKVNLIAGDSSVLVDDTLVFLNSPVDLYQGMVVVPAKFKEQVFDTLFKECLVTASKTSGKVCIKKIVIDAGHGGNDPGALGKTGLREKDVNLDIARRLAEILRKEGIEVVMTRTSDTFIPLPTRSSIANNSGADLFVSVHSNANRVRSLNGFEAYYVAPTVSDSSRAVDSAKSASPNLDSKCFASNSQDLKAIVWDMMYTNDRAESIQLASDISDSVVSSTDSKMLGVKAARYQVLRDVRMPAVLIEVGFVSNSDEERMLKNGFYRQKLAESIADGIMRYGRDPTIMEAAQR